MPEPRKRSTSRGFGLIERVVGRADERAGLHVLETHLFAEPFVFRKFLRVDKANYGKMFTRRLEILAKR